jgi:hypothetical protein
MPAPATFAISGARVRSAPATQKWLRNGEQKIVNPLAVGLPRHAREVTGKRTEKAVTFDMGGGKFAAVSGGDPFFTPDDAGTLVPVEQEGKKDGTTYVFSRLPDKTRVRFDLTRPSYRLWQGGKGTFTFSFHTSAPGVIESSGSVVYQLNPTTLLRWRIQGNHVKQEIWISDPMSIPDLSFFVTADPHLNVLYAQSGLSIADAKGTSVFSIPAPILTDARSKVLDRKVTFVKRGNAYDVAYDPTGLPIPYALDPSSGPNNPGTFANDTSVGNIGWYLPSNAASNDDNYADAFLEFIWELEQQDISYYLKATNFGFSLASDATINGIVMAFERRGYTSVCDYSIKLVKGGTIQGNDKADCSSDWPYNLGDSSDDAYATYGANNDLWGLTWSASDINASNFGTAISAVNDGAGSSNDALIDHIRLTVYYTATSSVQAISGTVYTDEGRTTIAAGRTVSISINGAAVGTGSTTTASDGTYTLSGLVTSAGQVLTVYLDGATEKAVTVTVAPGTDISGFNLYQNRLITRCDDGGCSITNTNLDTADNNGDTDISAIYSVNSGVLNVKSGKALLVGANATFTPGANVNVGSGITLVGTLAAGSNTLTLSGTWLKNVAGAFTAGTSTVLLDGTNQTMSGSTTFYNLTKTVTSAATLTFWKGTTQTISNTLTLNGAANNLLSLRSSHAGTQWTINPQGTRSLTYIDVKDSTCSNATACAPTNSGNSGNNTNWTISVTFSGTVYSDQGRTRVGAGVTVYMCIGGNVSTTTNSNGDFTVSYETTAGQVVNFKRADTNGGNTVTLLNSNGLSGVEIYEKTLITRCDNNNCALTNTDLETADDCATDIFTVDSGILNVKSGKALWVWNGHTFTPGGNVNVGSGVTIAGTLNAGSNTLAMSGAWLTKVGGALTPGTSTVIMDGTNQSFSGSTTFYNLTKTVTVPRTLTFWRGTTQTVSNTLTWNGAASNLLSLRSSHTGTPWFVNPQGTRNISYVDVKDSANSNGTAINCVDQNCTDSGNNTNWSFILGSVINKFKHKFDFFGW